MFFMADYIQLPELPVEDPESAMRAASFGLGNPDSHAAELTALIGSVHLPLSFATRIVRACPDTETIARFLSRDDVAADSLAEIIATMRKNRFEPSTAWLDVVAARRCVRDAPGPQLRCLLRRHRHDDTMLWLIEHVIERVFDPATLPPRVRHLLRWTDKFHQSGPPNLVSPAGRPPGVVRRKVGACFGEQPATALV